MSHNKYERFFIKLINIFLNFMQSVGYTKLIKAKGKGRGKVHPRTGHEGPEGE
jgi:hypothetical protein